MTPELPNLGDVEIQQSAEFYNYEGDLSDSDSLSLHGENDMNFVGYYPLSADDDHLSANGEECHMNETNENTISHHIIPTEESCCETQATVHSNAISNINLNVVDIWNQPRPQELEMNLDTKTTTEIINAMANFTPPNMQIPEWANGIAEERWKQELLKCIRQRKGN